MKAFMTRHAHSAQLKSRADRHQGRLHGFIVAIVLGATVMASGCDERGGVEFEQEAAFCESAEHLAIAVTGTCASAFPNRPAGDAFAATTQVEIWLIDNFGVQLSSIEAACLPSRLTDENCEESSESQCDTTREPDCEAFGPCLTGEGVTFPESWPATPDEEVETTCGIHAFEAGVDDD